MLQEGKADEEEDAKKTAQGEVAYKDWWALQPLTFVKRDKGKGGLLGAKGATTTSKVSPSQHLAQLCLGVTRAHSRAR